MNESPVGTEARDRIEAAAYRLTRIGHQSTEGRAEWALAEGKIVARELADWIVPHLAPAPRVVETPEEADALPDGTVVRTVSGLICEADQDAAILAGQRWLMTGMPHSLFSRTMRYPLTVLHTPPAPEVEPPETEVNGGSFLEVMEAESDGLAQSAIKWGAVERVTDLTRALASAALCEANLDAPPVEQTRAEIYREAAEAAVEHMSGYFMDEHERIIIDVPESFMEQARQHGVSEALRAAGLSGGE